MYFSFIVPCYNSEKTITACLNSLFLQSENAPDIEYEIITIDNNSTDNTAKIIRELGLRPIYVNERSRSIARNTGSLAARGKYLCFIDSDVVLHPLWMKQAFDILQNNSKLKIIGFPFFHFPPENQTPPTLYHYEMELIKSRISRTGLNYLFINTKSCIYERECFFNLGCFDESLRWYEDLDLSMRACMENYYLEEKMLAGVLDTEKTLLDVCKKAYFSGKETVYYYFKWSNENSSEIYLQMIKRGYGIFFYFKEKNLSYVSLLCFIAYLAGLIVSFFSPRRLQEIKKIQPIAPESSYRPVSYSEEQSEFLFNSLENLNPNKMPKVNLTSGRHWGKTDLFVNPSYYGRFTGSGRHLLIGNLLIKGAGLSLPEHKNHHRHSSGTMEKKEAYREFIIGKAFEVFEIFPKYYTLGKYKSQDYFIVRSGEAPRIAQIDLAQINKEELKKLIWVKLGKDRPFHAFLKNFFSPIDFNLVHQSINIHNVNILGQFLDLNSFTIFPNEIQFHESHLKAIRVVIVEALKIFNWIFETHEQIETIDFDHSIYKHMLEEKHHSFYKIPSNYFQPLSASLALLSEDIMNSKEKLKQFIDETAKHQARINANVS